MAAGGSGRFGESIEMRRELIDNAFAAAWNAHKSPDKLYLLEENCQSNPPEVIISFPGSGAVKDWYSKTTFGETVINLRRFPSLRSIGNCEPAFVNIAFALRFEGIMNTSSLETEVDKAMSENKQIVFTGHSSGGPMAILATLWVLEKYLTQNYPPLCATFGSPLVGNHIFSHATRRENWSRYFFHFVMRYDIVPRILLAPLNSFDQRVEPILQFFDPKSKSYMSEPRQSTETANAATDFYFAVMSNAATVTSHAASKLMHKGETSSHTTLETPAKFIPLSPYRPFGTYIFCTGYGIGRKQIVIKNTDAVLQLLFFSAQLSTEAEAAQVPYWSLREHSVYGTELQQTSGVDNVVYLDQLEKLPLGEDDSAGHIGTINMALTDLGLSTRARLSLQAATELERWKLFNEDSFNKKKDNIIKEKMMRFEEYRKYQCDFQKVGYYDDFKGHEYESDFKANVRRLELASMWDEIIEKLRSYELPDEFESKPEWVELGTRFRRLVEPLDIANYYRHARHHESGSYMGKGRPLRYKYTERWLEHAERRPQGANYSESCFWAEVEDLLYIASYKNNWFEEVKGRVLRLEGQIKEWSETGKLAQDAFFEGSTLMKWWKGLPLQHREVSCITSLIIKE